MFRFNSDKRRREEAARDAAQSKKMEESQAALLTAAISTANVAQDVTVGLKRRLDDVVKQFESTARVLRDGLILCREDGTITTFNPAAERLFEVKAGLALKRSILEFFDIVESGTPTVQSLWASLRNDEAEVLCVRNGQTFPARVSFSVLTRHDESAVYLLLIHEETSNESRYQSMFQASLDGIVVVMNEGGEMLAINPAVGRMFGYSPFELTSMNLLGLVSMRDRVRVSGLCRQDNLTPHHFTAEGKHSSGRILDLIFTLSDIEWDGNKAILASIKDVTEMRKVEQIVSLKRDNGIDIVCSFDPTFRITFANQAFANLIGIRRTDLVGRDFREFVPEDDLTAFIVGIGDMSCHSPTKRSTSKREGKSLDWVDHMICDEGGLPLEYQRIGRDVSHLLP